jgi:hypothetical protein
MATTAAIPQKVDPKARAKFLKGMIAEHTKKLADANLVINAARDKLAKANNDHKEFQRAAMEARAMQSKSRNDYEAAMEVASGHQGEISKLSGELASIGEV